MTRLTILVVVALVISCAAAFKASAVRKDVKFTPLDPAVTDPTEFYLPLFSTVSEDYCSEPRYPVVPTPGAMATNILNELLPNGTVPKVPPKPTNTWQKNVWGFQFNETDEDHWNAIYPYPYVASPKDSTIFIMYPGSPVNLTENRQIEVGFDYPVNTTNGPAIKNMSAPWMSMSLGYDLIVNIPNTRAQLDNVTAVGVSVNYIDVNTNRTVATAYFVKGSPYINIECFDAQLGFGNMNFPFVPPVIGLNDLTPDNAATGTDFLLTTAAGPAHPQGVSWHAYFNSSVSLYLPAPPTLGINLTAPFTGLLQIACGEVNDQAAGMLEAGKGSFAKGADFEYDIDDSKQQVTMKFKWEKGGNASKPLTMLALRHHIRLLDSLTPRKLSPFWVVKGNLTAVIADEWDLTYNLTTVAFGDQLSLDPTMVPELEKAALNDYNLRVSQCPGDNITYGYPGHMNMELYAYVRDIAQMADIAMVLETLGKTEQAINMSKKVLECMGPVLSRPKAAPSPCEVPLNNYTAYCVRSETDLYFDQQFGGLVTSWYTRFAPHYCACDLPGGPTACIGKNYCDNLHGWAALANYGNPIYNDHHFQYGYIIKSLAWLLYYQGTKGAPLGMNATVVANVTKQALLFAREIGNPDATTDPYFAYVRHKDVFDGHSWAEGYDYSGRFVSWNNQQSGGESINSYYAIYLLGLALNDTNVRDWGRVNLATEAYSIHMYQHLSNETKDKDDEPIAQITDWGKCISTLYGMGLSGQTYFGPNPLFQCAITFLPITPFTHDWLTASWANETAHWLNWVVNESGLCVFYDPQTMSENPCPGTWGKEWKGNEWGCCPTNEGYVNNQWRTYPQWLPYLYVLESFYNATGAFDKLTYTGGYYEPTTALPFPYLANRTTNSTTIVGYQSDNTLTAALFFVATHGRQ
ncbi:cell surface glycoside hydrolase, putative [Bodo saltans]|uniref:glucan endo-1,3-beta-D-glucosidase n=1 Tax=Bodo saltans TaxID=75058 RepID=A0A0S4KM46_BODSA|nr:cell surface glycoside hydrolase, putative [Bodo saltans]|eukprot:CUI15453.1 cell surface glycoside hydrolase, putative [Bodo saltans]